MAYRLRSLTLTLTATISGTATSGDPQPFADVGTGGEATVSVSLGPISASGSSVLDGSLVTGAPTYGFWVKHITGCSGVATGDLPSDTSTGDLSVSQSGSITLTVPCYLCFEYIGWDNPDQPFGTIAVVDSPPWRKRRYFLVGNGDATADISWCGLSCSGTVDVRGTPIAPVASVAVTAIGNGAHELFGGYLHWVDGHSDISVGISTNVSADGVVGSSPTPYSFTAPPFSGPPPGDGHTVTSSASADGTTVEASTTNGGAGASATWTASRHYSLDGIIRAMEQAYPDTLTLINERYTGDTGDTFTASGSFSRSATQVDFSTDANAGDNGSNNNGDSHSLANMTPFGVAIDSTSLTANGDEPLCRRVLLRSGAEVVGGLTIDQDASATVEDWSGGSATGTGSGTPTITAGTLQIVTSGSGTGGASRAYSPDISLASYRYLRVPLKSTGAADVPVTVTIGSYSWATTTGADGTTVNRDLDLCAPTSVSTSALNDNWDTRWPTPTTYPSPTSGPYDTASIAFSGIPASRTVTIGALSLRRVNEPTLTLLPTLYAAIYDPGNEVTDPSVTPDWPVKYDPEHTVADVTSQTYVRRFLLGNTDGRGVPEETDMTYTRIDATPTSYSWGWQSIQDLADAINVSISGVPRWPGWLATVATADPGSYTDAFTGDVAPADPYYYNAVGLLATEVFGGGALYDGTGWTYGFDQASGSLSAQPLFDQVEFSGLENDDEIELGAAIILRAAAQGLVFGTDRAPKPGVSIDLRTGSGTGTPRSQGTSRTPDGWYHTSSNPFGKASIAGTVYQTGRSSPSVDVGTLYTRHRHRAVIVGALDIYYRVLALDHPRQWLHIGTDAQIWTYHAATQVLAFQSGDHPVDHWLSLATDARRALLVGAGQTGTDEASVFTSRDGGKTMTGVLMGVAGKTFAVATDSERGFTILLLEDPSDFTIYRSLARDAEAVTWETPLQVMAAGDPITGEVLSLTSSNPRGTGDLFLTVGAVDMSGDPTGSSSVYRSTNAGKDWTLVLS